MSVDKLVDSTQLDADLTSVANAIRTKGGTSASLAFPADFVSAIAAIPSGGGWTTDGIAGGTEPSGAITFSCPIIADGAFRGKTAITSAHGIQTQLTSNSGKTGFFYGCTGLQTAVLITAEQVRLGNEIFRNCTSLQTFDIDTAAHNGIQFAQNVFNGCTVLSTLILRPVTIMGLWGGVGNLTGTPFANGGTGGTIYIPKALYDHLGDGGSLDYKAATNWSTVDGYGTITWAQIEGSYYETHYADGTLIPT